MQPTLLESDSNDKPIVVIVLEGRSDNSYLSNPIFSLYRKKYGAKTVFVQISDITSIAFGKNEDVGNLFDTLLETELKSPRYKIDKETARNIKEIVHIIDIDSCYILDSKIIEDKTKEKVFYTEREILYKSKDFIINRNKIKRDKISVLIQKNYSDILGTKVKYKLYYFSINIDHFYAAKLNLSNVEKAMESETMFIKYSALKSDDEKIDAFKGYFVSINPIDMPKTYLETWQYISISENCLKRSSNLFLITDFSK